MRNRSVSIALGLVVALVAANAPLAVSEAGAAPARNAAAPRAKTFSASSAAYPFPASSIWRTKASGARVVKGSSAMARYLDASVKDRYNGVAAFNAYQYNSAVYVVPKSTPRQTIAFSNCQNKPYTPSGLFGPGGQFSGVPMPANAQPAVGTDGTLTVYSPSSDQLWEFWKAKRTSGGGWHACWGGRIDHVSRSTGFFERGFGVTATGLSVLGGLVTYREIQRGRIDHAMSLAVPRTARYSKRVYPAQRSDGWDTNAAALPEGSRLRLNPSVDVDSLHLSRAGKVIARAAQKYGFYVTDTSGAVAVIAEALPTKGGTKSPWEKLLKQPSYSVLSGFPWSKVQVVEPPKTRHEG